MASGKPAPEAPKPAWTKAGIWTLVITVAVAAVCVGAVVVNNDSGDTRVPPPTATERADTVAVLKRNAEAHGICYGWQLQDGYEIISVGSNLGDGVPASSPDCPRWAQVVVSVTWTAEKSDFEDYASVDLEASRDIDPVALYGGRSDLDRFGVTQQVLVDDPGWATTRAAVILPLLLVEAGLVEPVPVATAPAAAPSPLPDAGSDFWRDRWAFTLAVAGLLLITALLFLVGVVQRRRQRRAAAQPASAGGAGGGRTRPGS